MLSYEEFRESMLEVKAWFDKLDQINAVAYGCGIGVMAVVVISSLNY